MGRRKNFSRNTIQTGNIYGSWTVIGEPDLKAGHWKCRCSCGYEKDVEGYTLLTGRSTRCRRCGNAAKAGALRKSGDKVAARQSWAKHRQNARSRGLESDLSFEEFYEISRLPCSYCGSEPTPGYWSESSYKRDWHEPFISNGIDRVDNELGYVKGNMAPCCIRCNRAKNDMSLSDWKNKIREWSRWLEKNND